MVGRATDHHSRAAFHGRLIGEGSNKRGLESFIDRPDLLQTWHAPSPTRGRWCHREMGWRRVIARRHVQNWSRYGSVCSAGGRSARRPGCGGWRNGSTWSRRGGHEVAQKSREIRLPTPFCSIMNQLSSPGGGSVSTVRSSCWPDLALRPRSGTVAQTQAPRAYRSRCCESSSRVGPHWPWPAPPC